MNPEQTHEDIVKELAGRVHIDSPFAKLYPSDVNDWAAKWGLFTAETTADEYDLIEVIYELEYQLRFAHQRIQEWWKMKLEKGEHVSSAAKRFVFTKTLSEVFGYLNEEDWKRRFGVHDTEVRNMAVEVLEYHVADLLGMHDKPLFERKYFPY